MARRELTAGADVGSREARVSEQRVRVMQLVQHAALGGATLMAMELAERLDPRRWEVALAVGLDAGPEGSLLEEMRTRRLEVIALPDLCRSPHPRRDARAILQLARALATWRPTIVHTHGSKPRFLLPAAAQLTPVPVRVAHLWGWEWQPAGSAAEALAYTLGAGLVDDAYDALIACSDAMRAQGLARRVGRPEQYEVVLPSVDLHRFTPEERARDRRTVRAELALSESDFVVGSVLRLAPQKAPEVLVRAAALTTALPEPPRWLLIGGGPDEERVRALIARLDLTDHVRLLGPRRDVPRLLRACDAFALASAWEPFGIVYLEAAAVGLPTVGAAVDGVPEAVADGITGILVPPGRPLELAAAVARLATDRDLARQMGAAGMARAQQFTPERFADGVAAVYERLLASSGGCR